MSQRPKHILVIRLSAMGDVAMTVPVIRAFTEQYPEVKLTVLTKALFIPFFDDIPNVKVHKADVKGKHKGIFGLYRLSKELRQLNIDAVADLHNVLRSKILKIFLFGKWFIQINKGRAEKKALVSGEKFIKLQTTHERYADVFDALGFKIDLSKTTFPKRKELTEPQKVVLNKGKIRLGIAPFAAFNGKVYPMDLMEIVIAQLPETYHIFLFGGGQKEIDQLDNLASKFDTTTNLAGKFSLEDELKLISNLDLMVSMDSGNAHIAAMLGIPVISIWGVTHPYAGFAPFQQLEEHSLLADRNQFPKIPTSIYGNKHLEGYEDAIRSITPDQVSQKINEVISKGLKT